MRNPAMRNSIMRNPTMQNSALRDPALRAAPADPAALDPSALARRTMVDCQIRTFDVTDAALLARMLETPRERFLPAALKPLAYSDASLRLPPGAPGAAPRSLTPPLILARLLQGARVMASDKALIVAAGCGYATALVAGLAHEVVALEADPALFAELRANLDGFGLGGVRALRGPLAAGAPDDAPFDLIVIDGAVAAHLAPLLGQLKDGGRLVTILRLADGTTKAVRYDKAAGAAGYRILFDAPAPVLEAFAPAAEFAF